MGASRPSGLSGPSPSSCMYHYAPHPQHFSLTLLAHLGAGRQSSGARFETCSSPICWMPCPLHDMQHLLLLPLPRCLLLLIADLHPHAGTCAYSSAPPSFPTPLYILHPKATCIEWQLEEGVFSCLSPFRFLAIPSPCRGSPLNIPIHTDRNLCCYLDTLRPTLFPKHIHKQLAPLPFINPDHQGWG